MESIPVGVTGGSGSPGPSSASPAANSGPAPSQAPAGVSSSLGDASHGSDLEGQAVPWDRFKGVNDKYTSLKWAEGMDRTRAEQALALAEWVDQNPRGFYEYFGSQLRAGGYIPAEQVQAAARTQGVPANGVPGPDFVDPSSGAKFYSAERLQQMLEQFEQRLTQRVQPLAQSLSQMELQGRARSDAQQLLSQAKSWAHFDEYRPQILNAMRSNPQLSLQDAYIAVVVPELGRAERATFATELQNKPGATTVNPGGLAPAAGGDARKLPMKTLLARAMQARGLTKK